MRYGKRSRCEGGAPGPFFVPSLRCPAWMRRAAVLPLVPRYTVTATRPFSYLVWATGAVQIATPRQSGAAAPFGVAALSCQACLSFLRRWSRRGNRGEQAVVRRFMSEVMAGSNLDVADELRAP